MFNDEFGELKFQARAAGSLTRVLVGAPGKDPEPWVASPIAKENAVRWARAHLTITSPPSSRNTLKFSKYGDENL
jgi:hypothetical protein